MGVALLGGSIEACLDRRSTIKNLVRQRTTCARLTPAARVLPGHVRRREGRQVACRRLCRDARTNIQRQRIACTARLLTVAWAWHVAGGVSQSSSHGLRVGAIAFRAVLDTSIHVALACCRCQTSFDSHSAASRVAESVTEDPCCRVDHASAIGVGDAVRGVARDIDKAGGRRGRAR